MKRHLQRSDRHRPRWATPELVPDETGPGSSAVETPPYRRLRARTERRVGPHSHERQNRRSLRVGSVVTTNDATNPRAPELPD